MTGNTFRKGHRLRLVVAGAFFPHFSRNLQTGASEIVSAVSRPDRITCITPPAIPRASSCPWSRRSRVRPVSPRAPGRGRAAAAGLVFLLPHRRSWTGSAAPGDRRPRRGAERRHALESDPTVIRFGTPAAEVHEVHGFEHSRHDPAAEPSAGMRRRAEVRLRWSASGAPRGDPRSRRPAAVALSRAARAAQRPQGRAPRAVPGTAPLRVRPAACSDSMDGGNALSFVFGAETDAARPDRCRRTAAWRRASSASPSARPRP